MSSTITRGLFGYFVKTSKMLFLTVSQLPRAELAEVSVGGYRWFLSTMMTQFEGVWSRKYCMYSGW